MKTSARALALILPCFLSACGPEGASQGKAESPSPVTRGVFLEGLGLEIVAELKAFRESAEDLQLAAEAYCRHMESASHESLRSSFSATMLRWEQLELMQIGPLAVQEKALKSKIYGWPQLSNECRIDEEALQARKNPAYLLPPQANRKGLQALEYLIFESTLQSACSANHPTRKAWDALDSEQRQAARCAYLQPLTAELVSNAHHAETIWGQGDANALSQTLGDPLAEQAMLQEVFTSLFYVDLEIKNYKLAAPAGQDPLYCHKTPAPCPEKEELRHSQLSKQALVANFQSLATIILGFGDERRAGLADYLRERGGHAPADRSETEVTWLLDSAEKQSGSLSELIKAKGDEDCRLTQESWLCQVRLALSRLVTDFKGEYATLLQTQVPQGPQGDND